MPRASTLRVLPALIVATLTALVAGNVLAFTQSRTVWSGVYSKEQADRGRRLYLRDCAQCHGENLTGGESASELVGEAFLGRWDKKSVGALFDVIRSTMPDAAPGSLTQAQYTDLVAYLLSENAFPAGKDELPRDPAAMTLISIVPKQ